MYRIVAWVSALMFAPIVALGQPTAEPESIVARNQSVLAKSPGAEGLFAVQPDGRVLHLASGLRCPARLSNLALWHLETFKTDGTDVGCDYGRADAQGHAVSKLTIFVVKTNRSLDDAFAAYKTEITENSPSARYKGEALKVAGGSRGPEPFGDYRSAEYLLDIGSRQFTSDLLVAKRGDWVIEVRGTFPSEIVIDPKQTDPAAIAAATLDLATPALALMEANQTLEQPAQ